MNSFEKYEDFFPKKVYRCPCVLPAVKHCFKNDEYSLCEILDAFLNAFKTVIIISCYLDCVRFEAVHNSKIMQCLDSVKCRFVVADRNAFGESYDDEIFVGNHHKCKNAESEEISFNKRPLYKSCFTSLKKLRYEHFCTTCQKISEKYFVENLYVFSGVSDW